MSSPFFPKSESVFRKEFDVVVCGAGYIGLAAACRVAEEGKSVLLLEASGDLLWESSRALENRLAEPSSEALSAILWPDKQGAARRSGLIDRARVEVEAAHRLLTGSPEINVLLHAAPVAAVTVGESVVQLKVATKSGVAVVRGRVWLDATEEGILASPGGDRARRPADVLIRSIVLHAKGCDGLESVLSKLCKEFAGMEVVAGPLAGEWRLRWKVDGGRSWHTDITAVVTRVRALADEAIPDEKFVVSHCSLRDYPIYRTKAGTDIRSSWKNVAVASPARRHEAVETLSDRLKMGVQGADAVLALGASLSGIPDRAEFMTVNFECDEWKCDVAVAGAGTAGAMAGIAAARAGAETVIFDSIAWPGGVGTAGGVTGYFHGAPGGLQHEIDERAKALTALFIGKNGAGWHQDAKTIALLEAFEAGGVKFLGDARLFAVETDGAGKVSTVSLAMNGRLMRLTAKGFIDSTGDGDLCALAGAAYETGRVGDGRNLAYSQAALVLGQESPAIWRTNFDAGWVDSTDAEALSQARLFGLAQYRHARMKDADVIGLSPLLGLRQSRRILTDRIVTLRDMIAQTRFEDAVGYAMTVADSHSVDYEFEEDELSFYYWTCRGFRHRLVCELPYGMLIPRGLANVWIACRASGITGSASYGLRMQRDMQRLGEAAGYAAALAAENQGDSRSIDRARLVQLLEASGALPTELPDKSGSTVNECLAVLDTGRPGIHLWMLLDAWPEANSQIRSRLVSPNTIVSFLAAAIMAMAGDTDAEPRLIAAIQKRELGWLPQDHRVPGAFGECIDIPFWLQAVILLRRIGGENCLSALEPLASAPDLPFNVKTTLALTVEKLAEKLGPHPSIVGMIDALATTDRATAWLRPSRSLWRTLHQEPQSTLPNDCGVDTAQCHFWQLEAVLTRTQTALAAFGRRE